MEKDANYYVKETIYAKCKKETRIVSNGSVYKVEYASIVPISYSCGWRTFATYDTFDLAVAGREELIKQIINKEDTWVVVEQ